MCELREDFHLNGIWGSYTQNLTLLNVSLVAHELNTVFSPLLIAPDQVPLDLDKARAKYPRNRTSFPSLFRYPPELHSFPG
jgi:hypothetical protein